MTPKQDWQASCSQLRRLLKGLPMSSRNMAMPNNNYFKFGFTVYSRTGYYYIYNVKTDNVIATVKRSGDKVFIRYRDVSVYSHILSTYKYDRPTYHIKTCNLGHRRRWVIDELKSWTTQSYQEFKENFGKPKAKPAPELEIRIDRDMLTYSNINIQEMSNRVIRQATDAMTASPVTMRSPFQASWFEQEYDGGLELDAEIGNF